ncbi:MAG: hypothetical protein J7L96_08835 [Bacteroidales bacterium]|nr:hypothetical protein [Bacteroidales bacterium]
MGVAIIFVALFASAFGIFYMFFITRNKERMAIIDHGNNVSFSKEKREPREKRSYGSIKLALKFGMFLIGIGVGFVVAVLLDQAFVIKEIEIFIIGIVFIFGGLGLVSGYFLGRRIDQRNQ